MSMSSSVAITCQWPDVLGTETSFRSAGKWELRQYKRNGENPCQPRGAKFSFHSLSLLTEQSLPIRELSNCRCMPVWPEAVWFGCTQDQPRKQASFQHLASSRSPVTQHCFFFQSPKAAKIKLSYEAFFFLISWGILKSTDATSGSSDLINLGCELSVKIAWIFPPSDSDLKLVEIHCPKVFLTRPSRVFRLSLKLSIYKSVTPAEDGEGKIFKVYLKYLCLTNIKFVSLSPPLENLKEVSGNLLPWVPPPPSRSFSPQLVNLHPVLVLWAFNIIWTLQKRVTGKVAAMVRTSERATWESGNQLWLQRTFCMVVVNVPIKISTRTLWTLTGHL